MIYALHKFWHYLLRINKFIFYHVDHLAFMYLIKKPWVSNMITKWLLLFLENDFLIIYKLGQSHLVVDVLYKLPNITKNLRVPNQTTNVLSFLLLIWTTRIQDYYFIIKKPFSVVFLGVEKEVGFAFHFAPKLAI